MTFSFGFLFYLQKVRNMALDEVVILNVDTNTLETPFDDLQSLPNDVVCNEPLGLWLLCVYACVRACVWWTWCGTPLLGRAGVGTTVAFLWPKEDT